MDRYGAGLDGRPSLWLAVVRLPQGGEGVAGEEMPLALARGLDVVLPVVARHGGMAHDDGAVGCGGEPVLPVLLQRGRVGVEVVNAAKV